MAELRTYEVEVILSVTAPTQFEAGAALTRSGIVSGHLIGEAMVESTCVYGLPEEDGLAV